MYFDKYFLSYFAIIFVYGASYSECGVNEFCESNILSSSSSGKESLFSKVGEDSMLSLHNVTDWKAEEKICKCKNGRCETTCDQWKDGACRKTKQVCVCDPEFGKYDDKTCIYCNCGKGFNCTIDLNIRGDIRKCSCPDGFYDYSGECAKHCSEIQPCRNGGTCANGRCQCMSGTHGPFCERIFWCAYECRPRLIVDCVYNQEEQTYGCQCKNRSLVFDYDEWVCKPCPCGEGTCKVERHQQTCDCKVGYQVFKGQCKKCDCGPYQGCELHWSTGEKICKCRKGFFDREGTCLPCQCGHEEATCSLDNVARKVCNCPEGYEDKLGLCEKNKENCTCHSTAKCIETNGSFVCACEEGFIGRYGMPPEPGEPCFDIDECESPITCPRWNYQKCVNFPGSYMCQCNAGYEPSGWTPDPGKIRCEKYKVSWTPTYITIGVIILLSAVSVGFIAFLKYRESSRRSS